MPRWTKPGLVLAVVILLSASTSQAEGDASLLLMRWQASRVTNPTSIADPEIKRVELLFARSLDRPMEARTVKAWSELGFVSEAIRLAGDPCHLLFEHPDTRLGRGMFLLCPTRPEASSLLIPHGIHDRFTAELGALFAAEGRFSLVAWNTAPRNAEGDHELDLARHDVAHITESYFTGLARAASVLGLPGPIIQLHGFAPYHRSTDVGRGARAILSSGTSAPHRSTVDIAECLEPKLGDRLLVYPTEVSELGGTTNRVAAVLRDWGRRDFLHLELSFALRTRLLTDVQARRSLIQCFGGSSR